MPPASSFARFLKILGPGLLMAGAAIGVSHLVQSTRAGAAFGVQLLPLVLLVLLFKYPFFEFGHRYAAATGESLLSGYRRMGRFYLGLFFVLNTLSGLITVGVVTIVTAGLAESLLGLGWTATMWSALLLAVCFVIVVIGHYAALDQSMKVIMAVLAASTVAALLLALLKGPVTGAQWLEPPAYTLANLGFMLALMGWMPAPIEISVWQSCWMEAREKSTGTRCTRREAGLDFNVGYLSTVVLAVAFILLGWLVMHGSGVTFPDTAAGFASTFIDLYRQTLGGWAGPIVAVSAFFTLFSTTLTCADGYSRALSACVVQLRPSLTRRARLVQAIWFVVLALAGLLVIESFRSQLKFLVDVVTIVAFLTGPVFAALNFRLLTSRHTPADWRPGRRLRLLAWLGMVYFVGFGLVYLYTLLF